MPNRRTVVLAMAALPVALAARGAIGAPAIPADTLETSAGPLTIQPVGHASLVLSQGSHVIYVDPAKMDFAGLPAPTGILITHAHPDHFDAANLEKLAGKAAIVAPKVVADQIPASLKGQVLEMQDNGSGELDSLKVRAVPAYNTTADRQQYHPKGVGNGYVVSFGDAQIYIAGDTEDVPEMRALAGISVAFLPMNLPYTMTEEQAADAVKAFKPKIVYPYHYRGSDTEKFKSLVGDASEVRLRDWYAGQPAG